jgi:dienelactone hydrolase
MMFSPAPINRLTACLVAVILACASTNWSIADDWRQPPDVLPGTDRLTWDDPLDVRLMDGAHRFIDRAINESRAGRDRYWKRDLTSTENYSESIQANRNQFRTIIGAVNRGQEINHNIGLPSPSVPVQMQWVGDDQHPAVIHQTPTYRIVRVRWPALKGVHGEGLLLEPTAAPAVANVVLIPDADQTPEQLIGIAIGSANDQQVAVQLVQNGIRVIVPTLINRDSLFEGERQQTHREWIYRQAFHMGRHMIGYEVEKVQAAIDWLEQKSDGSTSIGIAGYGEGGLIAFYTAAIDTRVDAVMVSGYFGPREATWQEPIYRNIWSLLRTFGDAEIATLIAPRPLVIEYSAVPEITNQKGELQTPELTAVLGEAERIDELTRPGFQIHDVISGPDGSPIGPWSQPAVATFIKQLGCEPLHPLQEPLTAVERDRAEDEQRQLRQLWELDDYTQWLVRDSDHLRNDFFLYQILPEHKQPRWSTAAEHPTSSAEMFAEKSEPFRQHLWEEVLGKFDEPLLPMNPRTVKVADQEKWVAYDVVLDVLPDLIAWGILMIPKDLGDDEQRPVVVVQHGRNGLPQNVMNGGYNQVAERLLERGFIVFAPHNLYRGEDRYRWLDRKANSVKASLFSFIIAQHDQITCWLDSLPFVDGQRIAFYGNSYGGETAVRVPPILKRYALSICASDFNDWTRKVADTRDWHSFMDTIEWEMPYFNMGNTFSYAELTYLMVPRPFMVERGHHDLVAPDQWVGYEFSKVRWLYDQLGLSDRREIEFFQGGHTMKGNETFRFLHQHLNWPP